MQFYPWLMGSFLFLLGACVGSFLNVVIWRSAYLGTLVTFMGRTTGLTLSWPPSHCPRCQGAIRWYQNIPVLAWLILRGRCAACRENIPVRYPLVELATALAFLALYQALFCSGWGQHIFTGLFSGGVSLLLDLIMIAVLFTVSAIDADWYEIPIVLTNLLIVVALASTVFGVQPELPTVQPHSAWARMTVGGSLGLILSLLLLWWGVLPRSFSQGAVPMTEPLKRLIAPVPGPKKSWPSVLATAIILAIIGGAWIYASSRVASLLTLGGAILIFLIGVLPRSTDAADETEQVLIESYTPSARAEISKELLFIVPPLVMAVLAAVIPFSLPDSEFLRRLLGVLLGILMGGGLIWMTRIVGTLVLGRVAMGLGDVHLMAAIGAVVGAPLLVLVFFMAPFFGLLWAIVLKATGKPNVLPYGPWLSIAGILVLLIGRPIEHWYLLKIFASPAPAPQPIQWPG